MRNCREWVSFHFLIFLHFLFIFSFSLHFLAARLPRCHMLCNPVRRYWLVLGRTKSLWAVLWAVQNICERNSKIWVKKLTNRIINFGVLWLCWSIFPGDQTAALHCSEHLQRIGPQCRESQCSAVECGCSFFVSRVCSAPVQTLSS